MDNEKNKEPKRTFGDVAQYMRETLEEIEQILSANDREQRASKPERAFADPPRAIYPISVCMYCLEPLTPFNRRDVVLGARLDPFRVFTSELCNNCEYDREGLELTA